MNEILLSLPEPIACYLEWDHCWKCCFDRYTDAEDMG